MTDKPIFNESYVPGVLQCDRCNFRLISSTLHVNTGAVTANNTADICPNDGRPMRRVTWREEAEDGYARWEEQVKRAVDAERVVTDLRERIETLARLDDENKFEASNDKDPEGRAYHAGRAKGLRMAAELLA